METIFNTRINLLIFQMPTTQLLLCRTVPKIILDIFILDIYYHWGH